MMRPTTTLHFLTRSAQGVITLMIAGVVVLPMLHASPAYPDDVTQSPMGSVPPSQALKEVSITGFVTEREGPASLFEEPTLAPTPMPTTVPTPAPPPPPTKAPVPPPPPPPRPRPRLRRSQASMGDHIPPDRPGTRRSSEVRQPTPTRQR
jgi:hypothetical protein